MKFKSYIVKTLLFGAFTGALCSCEDMLTMDSDYVIYYDEDHLKTPADTANSLVGIIAQLQTVADRTNILGEVRGDLVNVSSSAYKDLQDIANFDLNAISENNKYNNPRDYYNIINNCNYFLAYADTTARDNRGNYIFEKEYAQIKTIRAWVYLQLALNYGKVPFYTDPILKESDVEKVNTRKGIAEICSYFIEDLIPYRNVDFPSLKSVGTVYLANCFFPTEVVLGDLYLWRASVTKNQPDYLEAAKCYYTWITAEKVLGDGSKKNIYHIDNNSATTITIPSAGTFIPLAGGYSSLFSSSAISTYSASDLVTAIPMDSASASGNYSEIRGLYNNSSTTQYSLSPSQSLFDLSRSQIYNLVAADGSIYDLPIFDESYQNGDLRLFANWSTSSISDYSFQTVSKVDMRHVWIYRKTDLYLRLAEAMNSAGYPRFAYAVLATGLSTKVLRDSVASYCNTTDSLMLENIFNKADVMDNNFVARNGAGGTLSSYDIGIHSRGCGYTEKNPYYTYPADSTYYKTILAELKADPANADKDPKLIERMARIEWRNTPEALEKEQLAVDKLLLDEMALESCFEGKRYYDLMRFGYRHDATWLSEPIKARAAAAGKTISTDLSNKDNWFISWQGKIGPNVN